LDCGVYQQRSIAAEITTKHGINYTHIMLFGNSLLDLPNSLTTLYVGVWDSSYTFSSLSKIRQCFLTVTVGSVHSKIISNGHQHSESHQPLASKDPFWCSYLDQAVPGSSRLEWALGQNALSKLRCVIALGRDTDSWGL
jgi:hypothetical protein